MKKKIGDIYRCVECKKQFRATENEYGELMWEFCNVCQLERDCEDAASAQYPKQQ